MPSIEVLGIALVCGQAEPYKHTCEMAGIASRLVTFTTLLGLLATLVYFEAYSILYLLFSMPGISEFATMATSDAEYTGLFYLVTVGAYIYNLALVEAIFEFPIRRMNLSPKGSLQIENLFWDRFLLSTFVWSVLQLGVHGLTYMLPSSGKKRKGSRGKPRLLSGNMELFLVYFGALWGPGCTFFAALVAARHGIAHLVFLIVATQCQDNWQLVFGKMLGTYHPLPYLSPKKSLEGYVGGTVATIAQIWYFGPTYGHENWLVTSFFVVLFGIAGDLSMSAMKRWRGIKDTGSILPGVGGLLDRTDSLLLVLPAMYAFDVVSV